MRWLHTEMMYLADWMLSNEQGLHVEYCMYAALECAFKVSLCQAAAETVSERMYVLGGVSPVLTL